MDLYEHFYSNVPEGWEELFELCSSDIKQACVHLEDTEMQYVPSKEIVFAPFYSLKPKDIKVVIFGQDPYPTEGHANGHAFSCNVGVPPSLRNIYKEIKRTHPNFVIPKHGDLTAWVKQGVMLLNMCPVYVNKNYTNKDANRWMGYISSFVEFLLKENKQIVWVLWGKKAEIIKDIIKSKGKILMSGHPSPLNSIRTFDTCGHFLKINEILRFYKVDEIDWTL